MLETKHNVAGHLDRTEQVLSRAETMRNRTEMHCATDELSTMILTISIMLEQSPTVPQKSFPA